MSKGYAVAALDANLVSAKVEGIPNILGGTRNLTAEFLRTIFPEDAAKRVARFFGFKSERTAEHRLLATRGFDEEEIVGIICTRYGGRYLRAIMNALPAEQRPEWWLLIEPLMEIADAQKLIAAARSKTAKAIRRTVDADDQVTAAIRRAQAISVSDPEFHSGTLAALGAVAGLFHRPVAAPARKGRVK